MAKFTLDMDRYALLARQAAAEGCVLLKNDKETLPLKKGSRVAVFGRIAFHYYKSGTGSGGLVNTAYVTGILDALRGCEDITLDQELLEVYEQWIREHPFNRGAGWGQEPWSQEEMPVTEALVEAAAQRSDMAVVVIGRTAGEDQDAKAEPGSYLLTAAEEDMLSKVCRAFEKTAVILNVGNIIDMKWVRAYDPSAVLYAWQGGQEGGSGVVDVLTGQVSPCGKLSDTIAWDISDYPSTANFGDGAVNVYQEDIYVGYRYFETFAKDKVLYPFGYGLSYTTFTQELAAFDGEGDQVHVGLEVTNTGNASGREVVQLYVGGPEGCLGRPARELKGYEKTAVLAPGEKAVISFDIPKEAFAVYDDSGCTGHKSCYVLEAGDYGIYTGFDVRSAVLAGSFHEAATRVTSKLKEVLAPVEAFDRYRAAKEGDGWRLELEPAPLRTVDLKERIAKGRPADLPYTGDQGYKLADVYDGRVSMEDFIVQLSDDDLFCIVRGEGMCSPKVTPGTAGAFGGVTKRLEDFGIPAGCCADGPSGIRMDCGTQAFSMPNGTCLGCTFNRELVRELYEMAGMELRKNNIDTLLGPGINIHRNPLNGRNFEYISEDPYLTGTMAAAQLKGMAFAGVTGTVKHFAGNNQEFHRRVTNSVVSERALREIYLKGFEMAVKDGGAYSIMTTYGGLNGIWTAGNYDLVTEVLRNEWGFDGLVMTDWWADMNEEGEKPSFKNTGVMVRAQNDLFMVVQDSASNFMQDTSKEALESGLASRGEFQRCAANICRMLMRSPVMDRYLGRGDAQVEVIGEKGQDAGPGADCVYHEIGGDTAIDGSGFVIETGHSEVFGVVFNDMGIYELSAKVRAGADTADLAQLSVSVFFDNQLKGSLNISGQDKQWQELAMDLGAIFGKNHYIKLYFSMTGMELEYIRFKKTGEFKMSF